MDRTLAVGATSGSLSALLLRLVSELVSPDHPLPDCPICPELDLSALLHWETLDPISLLVGLAAGLLVGPALDLAYLIRQTWRVWLASRVQQLSTPTSSLYKLA